MPEVLHGIPFEFNDEVFNTYLTDDRQWYLPLQDICTALGLDANGQRQRIQRDAALQDYYINIAIDTPYKNTTRKRSVGCLNIRRLPYWLGTIDAARVKEEHRQRVILFKCDFAEAAYQVFRSDFLPEDVLAEMDAYESPGQRQLNEIMDQAAYLRRRLADVNENLDNSVFAIGEQMGVFGERLDKLEARFEGVDFINSAQQKKLYEMLDALATARADMEESASKEDILFECWQEFKDRFRVPVYYVLPAADYVAAIEYLQGRWRFYFPDQDLPDTFLRVG